MIHHRRPAGPDLPDPPSRRQTEVVEVPEGRRVEERGERREAVHRLGGLVAEQVAVPAHSVTDGACATARSWVVPA